MKAEKAEDIYSSGIAMPWFANGTDSYSGRGGKGTTFGPTLHTNLLGTTDHLYYPTAQGVQSTLSAYLSQALIQHFLPMKQYVQHDNEYPYPDDGTTAK